MDPKVEKKVLAELRLLHGELGGYLTSNGEGNTREKFFKVANLAHRIEATAQAAAHGYGNMNSPGWKKYLSRMSWKFGTDRGE